MAVFGDLSVLLKLEQKNSSVPIGSYLYLSHTSLVIPKENLRTLIMKAAAACCYIIQTSTKTTASALPIIALFKIFKKNKGKQDYINVSNSMLCLFRNISNCFINLVSIFCFFSLKSSLVPLDTLEDSKGFVRIRNISKTKFWELKMNCNLTAVDTYYFKHVTTYSLLNKKITNVQCNYFIVTNELVSNL